MKTNKIIFWVSTTLLFLFEGVMPALTSHTELARTGISNLGYPAYFGTLLVICKVAGALTLILPFAPRRLKEWAYAGFTFNFLFAFASNTIVYGLGFTAVFPLIVLGVMVLSYFSFHRLGKPEYNTIQVA